MRVQYLSKGFAKAVDFTAAGILSCFMSLALIGMVATPLRAAGSAVSPNSLNYGTQAVGTASAPRTMTFTNNGRRRIKVTRIYSSSASFVYSGSSLPRTLEPGESLSGAVTFAPSATRYYKAKLIFTLSTGWYSSGDLTGTGVQTQAAVQSSITTQPVSQSITAGQTATFSVAASGTAPLAYQWKKNNTSINGATSSSYTTPATTTADSGAQFTVTVSNSVNSATSNAAVLTVAPASVAPSITTQPVSRTITAGQTATFSVAASGTAPLAYQWKKNNANISGATSSSYTTPATTTADNGAQFTVTVSNSVNSATSNAAVLTVTAASGQLSTSASSLSFGNINSGSSGSLSATLTNSGSSSITILGVNVAGAGFTPSGVSSGLILSGGSTATLNVLFAPAAAGPVTGSVTITSTASNPTLTINLSGTGVQSASRTVTLQWNPSSSVVSGYHVHRSTVSGSSYAQLTSSLVTGMQFTDSNVQSGQTYYYVVTAMDSSNVQSPNSNQAIAIVP